MWRGSNPHHFIPPRSDYCIKCTEQLIWVIDRTLISIPAKTNWCSKNEALCEKHEEAFLWPRRSYSFVKFQLKAQCSYIKTSLRCRKLRSLTNLTIMAPFYDFRSSYHFLFVRETAIYILRRDRGRLKAAKYGGYAKCNEQLRRYLLDSSVYFLHFYAHSSL